MDRRPSGPVQDGYAEAHELNCAETILRAKGLAALAGRGLQCRAMRCMIRTPIFALLMLGWVAVLPAQAPASAGQVTISYTLTRLSRIASNQWAIWIEDPDGRFVRTLFVTNFTGRRAGWKRRPQTLPAWLEAAGVRDAPQRQIDAVSRATPASGNHAVIWDLKDREGREVAPGAYRYRLEANISWGDTVMWTGTIQVGGGRSTSRAAAVFSPPEAEKAGPLVSAVSAVYEPAP